MGVCEWFDGCERILIFFKDVKCYLQIYPCILKKYNNKIRFFLKYIHKFKNYN